MAKRDGAEYFRCSNCVCSHLRLLDNLASYERVMQLDVACTFCRGDAPLCQHQRACALRVSPVRSRTPGGLTSPPRVLALYVFLLGRSESDPAPTPQPADPLKKKIM